MNPACPFCAPEIRWRILAQRGTVFAVPDRFPVTEGHLLMLPQRHTLDWFSLTAEEQSDAEALILFLREKLLAEDPTIIGINYGASAGRTTFHAHNHLSPAGTTTPAIPAAGCGA
jgi:diadenosine tetraphosphate (Ap4A) HIT family hydrolase